MSHVRVSVKVYNDNSGTFQEMPGILCEINGDRFLIDAIIAYFIAHYKLSSSWRKKVCQVTEMLLDYIDANQDVFDDAESLFSAFARCLCIGTIREDGRDPSNLYWLGKDAKNARDLLVTLSQFSSWMYENGYSNIELNPWVRATSYEQRLAWTALVNRNKRSLLGHLKTLESASVASQNARAVLFPQSSTGDVGPVMAFPDSMLFDLLFRGFLVPGATEKDDIVARYNWRDICITVLLNFGGLRVSEPFHLWSGDVQPDEQNPPHATVLVYHPTQGVPPRDFRQPSGIRFPTREAYSAVRYPGYPPRTKGRGAYFAGWKNPRLDDKKNKCMRVHWFPTDGGRLFMQAYTFYMLQRIREKIGSKEHPFLFVSFRGEYHGKPYSIAAYTESLKRAVRRIGLPFGKQHGTSDHGHRHAYGKRQTKADTGEIVTMRGLHHKSIESQSVYTAPTIEEITEQLEAASKAMADGRAVPIVPDLDRLITQDRNDRMYGKGTRNGAVKR